MELFNNDEIKSYCPENSNDEADPKKKKAALSSNLDAPLSVLGFNLTSFSLSTKYVILSTSMMISMCLYGYFQEYLIYGWFNRQFGMFAALLHFISCSICTYLERSIGSRLGSTQLQRRLPWMCHVLMCILKSFTQALTNLSMTEINYPAKVLFKSTTPVITMIIGSVWFRKTYRLSDYIVVGMLVIGLYVFLCNNSQNAPEWSSLGLFYAIVSLFGSSMLPILQEYWMLRYSATHDEMLCYSFYGSTIISFFLTLYVGELWSGIDFLHKTGTIDRWFYYFLFIIFGFIGAHCTVALTATFGALVSGITLTARKAVTLGLSFALFPSRNILGVNHILGACIFISGLIFRAFLKESSSTSSLASSALSLKDMVPMKNYHNLNQHPYPHHHVPNDDDDNNNIHNINNDQQQQQQLQLNGNYNYSNGDYGFVNGGGKTHSFKSKSIGNLQYIV